jgi:hypothetical protein
MGRMNAEGMAAAVARREVTRRAAVSYHLSVNHYPPHHPFMLAPALRAIAKARRGDWQSRVRMPPVIEHRTYGRLVPVHVLVESLHLDSFIPEEEV